MNKKKAVVVLVMLVIAAIFIIGADWAGDKARFLFHAYFADIAIPFGFYLLLGLLEKDLAFLKNWYTKAPILFGLCALSETLQYFGIYALARVFDPLDFLMYAAGVTLGVLLECTVLKRL